MQRKGRKGRASKWLLKRIFYVLTLLFGILIGVILCNWSYFTLNKEIKISELMALFISVGIAIYVGSNIQNAIIRRASDHEVLFEEIKRILVYIDKLEVWIDEKKFPFEECVKFFKKGTTFISTCQKIFSENEICSKDDFDSVLTKFNKLKQEITGISPVGGLIILDLSQSEEFDLKYREIRKELFQLLLK